MQPFEALRLERLGLRGRIRIVDGRRCHVAELEAHALAVLQVDCGNRIMRRLRLPPQEIADQRQAERLALLRMELRAGDIAAGDRSGTGPP